MVLLSSEKLQDQELQLPSCPVRRSEQACCPGLTRHLLSAGSCRVCCPCQRGLPAQGWGEAAVSPGGGFPALGLCRSTSAACGGHGLVIAGAEGPRGLVCRAPFPSARSPEVPPLCSCSQWINFSRNVSLSSSLSKHPTALRYFLELKNSMSSHSKIHPSEIHLRSPLYVTTQCKEITDPLI